MNYDLILVVDQGEVKEFGNHESLMLNKSYYFDIINQQIEESDIA